MPADSVLFFSPNRGHVLLQEEGVRIGHATSDVALDFLVDQTVREIRSNNQIHFEAREQAESPLFVRVEAPMDCTDRTGEPLSLPDLVERSVAAASTANGVLLLVFADGATLRCEPDPHYESWQVEGGHPSSLVICRPGGELSVWDETPPVPYGELRERDPEAAAALDEMCELYKLPLPASFPPPENSGRRWRWRNKRRGATGA
ncbi:MAG: DUF6188 family protein [Gaiellaceae bacterium]